MSVAEMMCHDVPNPPRIAVCLGGSARTFTRALVQAGLRDNVLRAFGAPTTLFAVIKTHDARGDERPDFRGTVDGDPSAVRRGLEYLGATPSRFRVAGLEETAHSEPPACPDYPQGFKRPEESPETQIGTTAHRASTTGQVESRYKCEQLISQHERDTGLNFTWVLFSRPDLFWFRQVFPWCQIEEAVNRGAKRSDWTFLVTREKAVQTMREPYEAYFNCSAPFLLTDNQESWEERHVWPAGRVQDQQSLLPAMLVRDGTRPSTPLFSCGEIDFYRFGASLQNEHFPKPAWYLPDACRPIADLNTCNLEPAEAAM